MNAPAAGPASQAVSEALAAIERWNPIVNAMITVRGDAAHARAAELDRRQRAVRPARCTAGSSI